MKSIKLHVKLNNIKKISKEGKKKKKFLKKIEF